MLNSYGHGLYRFVTHAVVNDSRRGNISPEPTVCACILNHEINKTKYISRGGMTDQLRFVYTSNSALQVQGSRPTCPNIEARARCLQVRLWSSFFFFFNRHSIYIVLLFFFLLVTERTSAARWFLSLYAAVVSAIVQNEIHGKTKRNNRFLAHRRGPTRISGLAGNNNNNNNGRSTNKYQTVFIFLLVVRNNKAPSSETLSRIIIVVAVTIPYVRPSDVVVMKHA